MAHGQVYGVHNSRPWFLNFFPSRLLCLFRKTKAYSISGVLVFTTIDTGGADTSLVRPTSLLIVFFSVRGTGCSTTGADPENRVGDQDWKPR
jgi:hypothetical protein